MAKSVVKRGSVVLIRYPFTDLTGSNMDEVDQRLRAALGLAGLSKTEDPASPRRACIPVSETACSVSLHFRTLSSTRLKRCGCPPMTSRA